MNDPAVVDGFAGQLGDRVLDAVLVNAGVSGPEHRSASAVTATEIGALMFTNAIAPVRLARSLADHVRAASVAQNQGGHELYRASKAALNSLTRGIWAEVRGRGVTVVSVHPGWVRTDMAGPTAPVSVEESAAGIVTVLEEQSGAHRHSFLDYTGKQLPW